MNCIFCKESSENSKSVEHIIPESLGNRSHTLEKGIVCDSCNQYFSTKVEKEVLDLPYFRSLRNRNFIPSKKNKIPHEVGFFGDLKNGKVEIIGSEGKILQILVEKNEIFEKILKGEYNSFKISLHRMPPKKNVLLSRFIGKIALEALAQKIKHSRNWNNDFINDEGLDFLREYVRYGKGKYWSYYVRKVYNEETTFINPNETDKVYQILNEYNFIQIEEKYLVFICIIMGVEYSLILNDQKTSVYENWLAENNHINSLDTDEYRKFNRYR